MWCAVECAIAAPNRSLSEQWRFIQIGPEMVSRIAQLHIDSLLESKEYKGAGAEFLRWKAIPGWCVVTTKLTRDEPVVELVDDFKSTSCAVQNLMVSLHMNVWA